MNSKDEDGRTVLHHTKGDVSLLLDHGADPNATDEGGWTPLMCAASSGDLIKSKILINNSNTDVNLINDAGCTALHYAASKGYAEIVAGLLQRDDLKLDIQDHYGKTTPLIRAVTNNRHQIAKKLLEARAKTNLKDCEGNTALHYAVCTENLDLVLDLLNHGALDNIKNNSHQTPLDLASPFMLNRIEEEM
jgi:ankyrin repeat protein